MDVLSIESLELLRKNCGESPNLVNCKFEELVDDLNLVFVPFNAEIGVCPNLRLPKGNTQAENNDLKNCELISTAFSSLSASLATDERLWTTLCFRECSDYVKLRWPLEKANNLVNHVQNHWFARTSRNRMRDNAVSRLWWMSHIARKVPGHTVNEVLRTLFLNSDYRSNLLERNSSANAINVVCSIISISQKAFDKGYDFDRTKFRTFMKKVDLIGKRTSLPSLSVSELDKLLSPIYAEIYEIEK